MAYIWILGDSWGDDWGCPGTAFGISPDKAFTYQFEQQHRVSNLARAGKGNKFSLSLAESAFNAGAEPPSHIIQFWTDCFRDVNFDKGLRWEVEHLLHETLKNQLQNIKRLKQKLGNPKWALIGGHAPLPDYLEKIFMPDFSIQNWRNDLLNKQFGFIPSSLIGQLDLFKQGVNKDARRTKKRILKDITEIRLEMQRSDQFGDDAHPSWPAYRSLSEDLLLWIAKTS